MFVLVAVGRPLLFGMHLQNKLQISFGLLVFRQLAHFDHAQTIPLCCLEKVSLLLHALTAISGTGRALKPKLSNPLNNPTQNCRMFEPPELLQPVCSLNQMTPLLDDRGSTTGLRCRRIGKRQPKASSERA